MEEDLAAVESALESINAANRKLSAIYELTDQAYSDIEHSTALLKEAIQELDSALINYYAR